MLLQINTTHAIVNSVHVLGEEGMVGLRPWSHDLIPLLPITNPLLTLEFQWWHLRGQTFALRPVICYCDDGAVCMKPVYTLRDNGAGCMVSTLTQLPTILLTSTLTSCHSDAILSLWLICSRSRKRASVEGWPYMSWSVWSCREKDGGHSQCVTVSECVWGHYTPIAPCPWPWCRADIDTCSEECCIEQRLFFATWYISILQWALVTGILDQTYLEHYAIMLTFESFLQLHKQKEVISIILSPGLYVWCINQMCTQVCA